jgi:MFS family permease
MRRTPPGWLVAVLVSHFFVQLTVSLARPVSTYRLLAFGADATAVGLVAASFALPPMVLAMVFGRFTDRRRPGLMFVSGALVASSSTLLMARADSVWEVGLWTALLGIGHLGVVVGAQSIVAFGGTRGDGLTGFGLLTMSAAFGQIAGPLLGGYFSQSSGTTPTLSSTSLSLNVAGIIGLLAVPFAAGTLRVRSPHSRGEDVDVVARLTTRQMLRTVGMPAALLASFGAKGSLDLVTAYLPLLGAQHSIPAGRVGILLGLGSAASLLARVSMPWLVRRTRTEPLMALTTFVSACCVALFPLARDFLALAVVMTMLGYLLAMSQTVTMVWVAALAAPSSRGSALGLRLASNRVGQVAVPGLAGLLSGSAGVTSVFYVLAGTLLGIAAVVIRAVRPQDR